MNLSIGSNLINLSRFTILYICFEYISPKVVLFNSFLGYDFESFYYNHVSCLCFCRFSFGFRWSYLFSESQTEAITFFMCFENAFGCVLTLFCDCFCSKSLIDVPLCMECVLHISTVFSSDENPFFEKKEEKIYHVMVRFWKLPTP